MTTAIRKTNTGAWAALMLDRLDEPRKGKVIGLFSGPGAKARAIKRAGTNTVIA